MEANKKGGAREGSSKADKMLEIFEHYKTKN